MALWFSESPYLRKKVYMYIIRNYGSLYSEFIDYKQQRLIQIKQNKICTCIGRL